MILAMLARIADIAATVLKKAANVEFASDHSHLNHRHVALGIFSRFLRANPQI